MMARPSLRARNGDGTAAVEAIFAELGSLGLQLIDAGVVNNGDDVNARWVELLAMNAGSQAERFSDRLRPGMAIASVNDVGTGGKSYDEVLGLIQAGGRPLSMVFAWPPGSAVVRFTEPGSLGL